MHTRVFPLLMKQGKLLMPYCKMLLIQVSYLQYWCVNTRCVLQLFCSLSWLSLFTVKFGDNAGRTIIGIYMLSLISKPECRLSVWLAHRKHLFILMICCCFPTLSCHPNRLGKQLKLFGIILLFTNVDEQLLDLFIIDIGHNSLLKQ